MAGIFRSGEVADDSRPSDRAREGSSRLPLLLRVDATPLRAPPTTEVVRGRIGEVQNLCHPLSTEEKVVKRNCPFGEAPYSEKANSGYNNNVFSFPGDSGSFSAILLTYKIQQEKKTSLDIQTEQTVENW